MQPSKQLSPAHSSIRLPCQWYYRSERRRKRRRPLIDHVLESKPPANYILNQPLIRWIPIPTRHPPQSTIHPNTSFSISNPSNPFHRTGFYQRFHQRFHQWFFWRCSGRYAGRLDNRNGSMGTAVWPGSIRVTRERPLWESTSVSTVPAEIRHSSTLTAAISPLRFDCWPMFLSVCVGPWHRLIGNVSPSPIDKDVDAKNSGASDALPPLLPPRPRHCRNFVTRPDRSVVINSQRK